jgi:hypothetical protein
MGPVVPPAPVIAGRGLVTKPIAPPAHVCVRQAPRPVKKVHKPAPKRKTCT